MSKIKLENFSAGYKNKIIIDLINLTKKKNLINDKLEIVNRIGNIKKIRNSKVIKKYPKILLNAQLINQNSKDYYNFQLLNNEWTAIIGARGAGKSTFMDLITGVALPLKSKNCLNTPKGQLNIEISKNLEFILTFCFCSRAYNIQIGSDTFFPVHFDVSDVIM